MATSGPAIAVINLPALASVLRGAGFNVIDGDTNEIANSVRDLSIKPPAYVVVIGVKDQMTSTWVKFRAGQGVPILVATSEHFSGGTGLPKPTRFVELPCTVDEIMSNFNAPPVVPGGDVVINADGSSDEFDNFTIRTRHFSTDVNGASRVDFEGFLTSSPNRMIHLTEFAAPSSAFLSPPLKSVATVIDADDQAPLSRPHSAIAFRHVDARIEISKVSCTYCAHVLEHHSRPRGFVGHHCPQCHREWTGLARAHCPACHETFSTINTSDLHLSGTVSNAHCLDPSEVIDSKGAPKLVQDRDGTWHRVGQRPTDVTRKRICARIGSTNSPIAEGVS